MNKQEYKEWNKIYVYELCIYDIESGYNKNSFKQTEVQVLKQNEDYICLDNINFKTLYRHKPSWSSSSETLDYCAVWRSECDIIGNRISLKWHSTKKRRLTTIRKKVRNFLNKKYGWIGRIVNLEEIIK